MFRGVDRYGLILSGGETVLAGVASPQTGAGNVLTVVPFGRGRIILCTLPMLERLEDDAPNTATAKRLLYNLAAWSVKQQRR